MDTDGNGAVDFNEFLAGMTAEGASGSGDGEIGNVRKRYIACCTYIQILRKLVCSQKIILLCMLCMYAYIYVSINFVFVLVARALI